MYSVYQKTRLLTFGHNFAEYSAIFKILCRQVLECVVTLPSKIRKFKITAELLYSYLNKLTTVGWPMPQEILVVLCLGRWTCDSMAGKPPQYFTEPHRKTHPHTLSGKGNEYSTVMLCGWGVRAGWLIIYMNRRVDGR